MKQLQTFLKDNRNEWSENTKKRIINRLSYEIDLPINDESDRKVVVVSSREPQHGKTTFILRLIGIKEEYEKEVGTLLRAGRPLGKSSTSTAIIYGKSHNDKYGISSGTLDDKGEMHFCENDDEMISRMQQIRNDVENGHRPPNTILWINLPNKYFGQDVWTENIRVNIIDLPGSGSSNDRERIYVEKLTQIYFRIATTNIIVSFNL